MLARRMLSAEVLDNGLGLPRREGALVIQTVGGDSRIIAIDDRELVLQNFPGLEEEAVGFAISPPPVNACVDTRALTESGLQSLKVSLTAALEQNLKTFGLLASDDGLMRYALQHPELQGVAYWYVSGGPSEATTVSEVTLRLRDYRGLEQPSSMRVGLACSTQMDDSLLKPLLTLAQQNRLPLLLCPDEAAQVTVKSSNAASASVIRQLQDRGLLAAQPTLLGPHGFSEEDIRIVQKAGCPLVYAASSSLEQEAAFPWSLCAKHGATVAFGSGVYRPGASLLIEKEVLAARQIHGEAAEPRALVWSAVKGGYRALGMRPARFVRGDSAQLVYCWQKLVD